MPGHMLLLGAGYVQGWGRKYLGVVGWVCPGKVGKPRVGIPRGQVYQRGSGILERYTRGVDIPEGWVYQRGGYTWE